jgi:diaminohydroxyphosphoribosylaminopyrimidine deaminase / 5-amino-6-(5-phosphoribosylamino)uracil reductase
MFDAADRRFMKMAITLAERGVGLASPNPSVGCIVVRDGKVVGRGMHEYSALDHAEVRALRNASGHSRNATVYVTLEPCSHQGRTPPCVDRLIQTGVSRVVVARIDPNPRVAGRGIERLRSCGIRVDVGLMGDEAGKIIEPFACHITTGLPLVVSKVGMSLDGKIGTGLPGGRWITSPESREFGQGLRLGSDALLVGINTVLADDPELTYRGREPKARPLIRAILDSRLRTPASARLFQTEPHTPVLIFCGRRASEARQRELERSGAEVVRVEHSKSGLDLSAVLKELGARDVLGLLVEGGGRIHWSFLSGNLIDKFYFIVAPMVIGGTEAILTVAGPGFRTIKDSPKFKVRSFFSTGPDVILETYPSWSRSIISPWLSRETFPSGARCSLPALKRR